MKRRQFLLTGAASVAAIAPAVSAQTVDGDTAKPPDIHNFQSVISLAEKLANKEDKLETLTLSGPFADLNYDQYRGIRFNQERAFFAESSGDFTMDLLPPGLMYTNRVRIYTVSDDQANEITFSPEYFKFDTKLFTSEDISLTDDAVRKLGWTGFRLRFPINSPDYQDEFAVFQGASYFRAIARNTLYGLSARGLAINTGNPDGEEFPRFSRFWIYTPKTGDTSIQLDALLESPSVTGAYHMEIIPGDETIFKINCSLFPRVDLPQIGIAPLTSMYYFSPARRKNIDDYRTAVHDSSGLEMLTGQKSRLWRVLANPQRLQFSAFTDENPKGFGLVQRIRQFSDYEDAEARYEKRASAWIRPSTSWQKGVVSLIEIPVDSEFNDNIISFWRPKNILKSKIQVNLNYDLIWSQKGPQFAHQAYVFGTRCGKSVNNANAFTFVVDYKPFVNEEPLNLNDFQMSLTASSGKILSQSLFLLPDSNIMRASFDFRAEKGQISELQIQLKPTDENVTRQIAETWMYQWLPA